MLEMTIRINAESLRKAMPTLIALRNGLEQGRPLLLDTVQRLGQYWGQNYTQEGSMVGGWPDLAERTQKERAKQGYDPQHPILYRSGSLMQATTLDFGFATQGFTRSYRQPYAKGAEGDIFSSLTLSDEQAVLSVTGWATLNQRTRAMWFFDEQTQVAAATAMKNWAENVAKEALALGG